MTFDVCHAPPTTTLAHLNPSLSINELEDPGAIAGSVQLEKRVGDCVGVVLFHPPREVDRAIAHPKSIMSPTLPSQTT